MKDGNRTKYLHEYFTTAYLLQGEITDLEEIKHYIIAQYVNTGLLKLIKPTYSTHTLSIKQKREPERTFKNRKDTYTLGFILRGEVRHCEEITAHIHSYVERGSVRLETSPYSKEKQYIVEVNQVM